MAQHSISGTGECDLAAPVNQYMHRHFIVLRENMTAAQAIEKLRSFERSGKIVYLYVVDEEERLTGVVSVRQLLWAPPGATVGSLKTAQVVSVPADASMMDVARVFLEHRFLGLPVVDAEGHIAGVIDATLFTREIVDLARRQHAESICQLIGVRVSTGRPIAPWASFRQRFPWLLCNMASGLACAVIVAGYESVIREVALLAMFLTLALALGESVSMQAMTLTIEYLMGHRLSWRLVWNRFRGEAAVAAFLGAACGLAMLAFIVIWHGQADKAGIVCIAVVLSILTACLLGVAIPVGVRLVRLDPTIAAGPVVLAGADIMTVLYYFGLMAWWLGRQGPLGSA